MHMREVMVSTMLCTGTRTGWFADDARAAAIDTLRHCLNSERPEARPMLIRPATDSDFPAIAALTGDQSPVAGMRAPSKDKKGLGAALAPTHANSAQELLRCAEIALGQARDNPAGYGLYDARDALASPSLPMTAPICCSANRRISN